MDNKQQNDNKELLNKKVYIIKKDEDDNDILDVKEYFEKEDKFLCLNPKISIGLLNKKHTKNKIEENNLLPSLGNQILKPRPKIKKKYYSQGKKLNFNSIYKSNSEKYIKFLAKKCKKKENDMLMNNIPNYRMKKQIKEYIENNKLLSEKFGNNYWLFSLRRPPKNEYTRFDFFNIGTSEREIWKSFTDYPDKDYELINFPYRKGKNNAPLYTEIYKDQIPKIDEYEDIKIEGKNLVKKEYDDIVNAYNNYNNKNNKIIFK